jgi:hypothetical protein
MRPVTRWRTRTAITGAADEGISGYEQYRDDLVLTYFPTMDLDTARLAAIRMVPLRIRKFQLQRASPEEAVWLRSRFNECSAAYGCRTTALDDRSFALQWGVPVGTRVAGSRNDGTGSPDQSPRRSDVPTPVSLRHAMQPSPDTRGLGLRSLFFCRGHHWVHLRCGPVTRSPSRRWLYRPASSASFPPRMQPMLQSF